jgi:hypothetical protein
VDVPFPLGLLLLSPSSATSFSQQLNPSGYLTLTNSITNSSLTDSSFVLLITSWYWPRRKHSSSVAAQLSLDGSMTYSIVACAAIGTDCRKHHSSVAVYGPLVSNGCCIVAYFMVIAWQQVYMKQYIAHKTNWISVIQCKNLLSLKWLSDWREIFSFYTVWTTEHLSILFGILLFSYNWQQCQMQK